MPGPGIPIIAGSSTLSGAGSSFLTGAASAVGSAFGGGLFGQSKGSKRRQVQQSYRDQRHYLPKIQSAQFQQHMKDVDKAGLHRLAALGIAPASGGSAIAPSFDSSPSPAGSAIETGINTALSMQRHGRQTSHQKVMAGLQLEEQSLRNDWLRTQIANSNMKRVSDIANSQQDGVPLSSLQTEPKSPYEMRVTPQKPYDHATSSSGYNIGGMKIRQRPGKLTMQGAEDALGDVGSAFYSPFSILQDIGYTLDQLLYESGHLTKPGGPRSRSDTVSP